jgi:hypothetical protein
MLAPSSDVRRGKLFKQWEVRVMKQILAFLLGFRVDRIWVKHAALHDDTLRANQGERSAPAFSFWRALVS